MAITDKTRKLLWGRSGNLCAFCKRELVMDGTGVQDESVVGDECHIIAKAPGGPRFDPSYKGTKDDYGNLILLCKVHHKLVDDQPKRYTAEILRKIKEHHEKWVRETLGSAARNQKNSGKSRVNEQGPLTLKRITAGRQILRIIGSAYAFDFDYDPPRDEREARILGGFLQSIQDWGDLWDELEAAARVQVEFNIDQEIQDLGDHGFVVYATLVERRMLVGNKDFEWPVAVVRVFRKENPLVARWIATERREADG
ncbi:MAG: HNH endonuclease signature motif containing protein [Bacillota bacterium]|nr:HNH endonuclease signature motif containing protein [Bacillota bacterium]